MLYNGMFEALQKINQRPKPYEYYTAPMLWNDPYISQKMLEAHLDESSDISSRNREFINNSVEWIISRFNIGSESKICDFGCGPGLYTSQFAEKRANVTGVDFSEQSIEHAQKVATQKNLKIEYVPQDYLQYSTDKRFDLITMIYCDFCALLPEQRKILLSKFYELLEDDGAIFLDVYSINHFNAKKETMSYERSSDKDFWSNFWSNQPYYVFLNIYKYEKEKLNLDKYTIIEESRTREIFNWIQCYSIQSLKKEFQENGFSIVEHYSDVSGAPYTSESMEIAIVAKKS